MNRRTRPPRNPRAGTLGRIGRLLGDAWTVFADGVWWLCSRLWRLNRRLARLVLPGQSRTVHSMVAALAVLLEVVGLWVAAADWAARN